MPGGASPAFKRRRYFQNCAAARFLEREVLRGVPGVQPSHTSRERMGSLAPVMAVPTSCGMRCA
jgi:hypothetical protein